MSLDLFDLLKNHPELVLFLLLTVAYLIGNIKIGSFDIGAPPGMLIAGLIFGHFGLNIYHGIETIGLFLFLYAVAFQAGPAFFAVVLPEGSKYISLALIATVTGFLLTYIFALVFQFDLGVAPGLLAGSLTSPAGVAAAIEAARENFARGAKIPLETILSNISVSYALTYLVGDVLVILLARSLPGWLRFDLRSESKKAAQEKHVVEESSTPGRSWALTLRAYELHNPEMVGKTVAEIEELTQCSVLRYKRGYGLIPVSAETRLEMSDRLAIWGMVEQQDLIDQIFGTEVADAELLGEKIVNAQVTITNPQIVGQTLKQLGITHDYACYVTNLSRAGVNLNIQPSLVLERGDVLALSGPQSRLDHLSDTLGYVERDVHATDLVTFASGVVLGFLIGQIRLKLGDISLSLGTAGGLLFVGILLGYLRSLHPTFGKVPPATLWLFKQLGLLFFLAGVGVEAGHGVAEAMSSLGPIILLCSVVISTVPVLVSYWYGRYILKMNPALLLGAATGAVTCTPAMAAVSSDAESAIPTIGYAGTYAFATIFTAIAASLMTSI
jgi:putative transport protein